MISVAANTRRVGRAGFTLIELLVVMGVIALLMALLVPTLGKIREQVNISRVTATIEGISMALEAYKDVHKRYPPDRHPQLGKSSQCLIYYLSGGSIFYDPTISPEDYPWTHGLYDTSGSGAGRRDLMVYYSFNSKLLMNAGGDAPGLIDPWRHRLIYNSGSSSNGTYNRYTAAKHGERKYDIFSTGPDGVYGTEDDIVNWRDRLEWGYDSYGLNDGTH